MSRKVREPAKKGCRRCGSPLVAWEQGAGSKWYLIELFNDPHSDNLIGDRTDFHSQYCGKTEEHARVQNEINAEAEGDAEIRKQRQERERAEQEEHEVDILQKFLHMTSAERRDELQRRRDEITAEQREPVSMDFMVEHVKWRAKVAGMQAELDLIEDFMDDLED